MSIKSIFDIPEIGIIDWREDKITQSLFLINCFHGFDNRIQHFGFFARKEIEGNKGRLLMLDIDFGRRCSLNCPSCFRRSNIVDDSSNNDLSYDQLMSIIDQAIPLGLRSIKICGAGEPTETEKFLQFIIDMNARNIGVAVFTKGQVLGGQTGRELCQSLANLKVSFMLSFQSFCPDLQDKLVGVPGHTAIRDRALINLVETGFNKDVPTRLALEIGPVTRANFQEALNLYVFARRRNIYAIPNFLMTSGKQIDLDFLAQHDISAQEKVNLAVRIYSWNIEHNLQTLKQIEQEGISCMPGIHPCNQVACGLYITANGNVVGCPGYGRENDIEGNIRIESLQTIWERSQNKKNAGTFNCLCPPKDGQTVPANFYHQVLKILKEKYGQ